VNASFQEKIVRYYEHADIGVAVAIEDGLITPVVRAADQKSLSQIAAEVRETGGTRSFENSNPRSTWAQLSRSVTWACLGSTNSPP
jgi:pyruvate dehydrogenase E2 component (dihydrolipoamide acetyltransferase)